MPNRNSMYSLYLAKVETTEGTDAVPDSTNNVLEIVDPFEPDYDNMFKNDADNRARGATLMPGDPLTPAGKYMKTARKMFFRGVSGAIGVSNKIEADPWFQAAGYAVTYSGGAGSEIVTYNPADTALASITEYYYRDGILYKHLGVRGELGIMVDVGGAVTLDFHAEGRVSSDADASMPASPSFRTVDWPLATDMTTFTVDGFTAGIIRKAEFKVGNSLQMRTGVKAPGGIQGCRINKRNGTFSITLEEDTHTTKDWTVDRDSKTPIAISLLVGGTQYNKLNLSCARAFIRTVKPSTDNGLALVTLEGIIRGTGLVITVQ